MWQTQHRRRDGHSHTAITYTARRYASAVIITAAVDSVEEMHGTCARERSRADLAVRWRHTAARHWCVSVPAVGSWAARLHPISTTAVRLLLLLLLVVPVAGLRHHAIPVPLSAEIRACTTTIAKASTTVVYSTMILFLPVRYFDGPARNQKP